MTYNIDEGLGDNHYNCPVVAYYPEVIAGNCPEIKDTKFIYDYVGLHRPKDFTRKITEILRRHFPDISKTEVREASDAAYAEYAHHMAQVRREGVRIMEQARARSTARSRRLALVTSRPFLPRCSISSLVQPAFSRPPMMAMVAGTAPFSRMISSTFRAVSTFWG